MARASLYFVLSPLTFCIPVGLTKHVLEYKIGSCSYWEPFGCLPFETTKKAATSTQLGHASQSSRQQYTLDDQDCAIPISHWMFQTIFLEK